MKAILLICALALFIACDEPSLDNNTRQRPDIVCGYNKAACSPVADWLVAINDKAFPDKIKIILNGQLILNECSGDKSPIVVRRDITTTLYARDFLDIGSEPFSFTIKKILSNCIDEEFYYTNAAQTFTRIKEGETVTIKFEIN